LPGTTATLQNIARRFDVANEAVQRRGERLDIYRQKNYEVVAGVDDMIDWFAEAGDRLAAAAKPSADPQSVRQQLRNQRVFNGDVQAQRARVKDLFAQSKGLLGEIEPNSDEAMEIHAKLDVSCYSFVVV